MVNLQKNYLLYKCGILGENIGKVKQENMDKIAVEAINARKDRA